MRDGLWRDSGVDRGDAKANGAGGRWRRRDPGPNGSGSSGCVGGNPAGLAANTLEIGQGAVALQHLHAAEGGAVSCATLTCGAEDRQLRRPEKTRSRIQTVCAECRREAKPLAEDAGRKRRKKPKGEEQSGEQRGWKEEEFQD